MNSYCVCTTPNGFRAYGEYWNKSGFNFITDNTKEKLNLGFTFTEQDIRKNLDFYGEVSKSHWWNQDGNKNIVWFYAHFRMLNYFLHYPDYDYYWFFDDDVKISNLEEFISSNKYYDYDFISYFIFKRKGVKSQPLVPSIDKRTFSNDDWFKRFPADGDMISRESELFGSFFPIVMFSRNALKELLDITLSGLSGYGEGFVPTVLNEKGHKMASLYQPDMSSVFFDAEKIKILHKGEEIKWEWI